MKRLKTYLSSISARAWAWLFPITNLLHFAEEYWVGGGYSAYLMKLRGVHFSSTRFVVAQTIGFLLMIIGILIARRLRFLEMMLVILGGLVMANGVSHTLTALVHSEYGPGLFTSIFVWLPLGIATLIRFHGSMKPSRYWTAVLIGIGINVVIGIFTLRGGRLG